MTGKKIRVLLALVATTSVATAQDDFTYPLLGVDWIIRIGGQPADALAPLPTLCMYYKHTFNDRWAIISNIGYFSANIDKYDGSTSRPESAWIVGSMRIGAWAQDTLT